MEIFQLSNEIVFKTLKSSQSGLSGEEVHSRLVENGPNEIAEHRKSPLAFKLLANFYHTFALLLWAAGIMAFIAGMRELGWTIFAVIVINALFSFWQEFQAEKAVAALKRILPAKAMVIRGGDLKEVLAADLVMGDIIVLHEGDNISADARILEENELRINAATLTGESEPVRKTAGPVSGENMTASEIPNLVLAGTSVAFGSGKAIVYATGMGTEFGKIASLTQEVKTELSPLQKEINRAALIIAAVALAMGLALFGVAMLMTPLTLAVAAIFAIGMIVANVPEGLLPTVTLSLAMAVKRMAKKNALVKRLSGVETLGSTTVICTDKTGTLTQNEMTVRRLWVSGKLIDVSGVGYEPKGRFIIDGAKMSKGDLKRLGPLLKIGALCNNARLVSPEDSDKRWEIIGDPTEASLLVVAKKWGFDPLSFEGGSRLNEQPFDSRRKRMSVLFGYSSDFVSEFPEYGNGIKNEIRGVWEKPSHKLLALVKGAPKEVLSRCSDILIEGKLSPLADDQSKEIMRQNDEMAKNSLRVLAMAYRIIMPGSRLDAGDVEQGMVFVGLAAMMDPPRPEVEAAIGLCHRAGVRVVMITGDYGLTAESVARRIGLLKGGSARIINGADLEFMTDDELGKTLSHDRVLFARVSPEHKMRIAGALQGLGEVVAMTGDGVNDAPALKRADIGVAMGIAGTDVAREAATIILTDDNFATIVGAVEEGRVVYDNMRKFLAYIFAHATPEIVPFVGFVLLGIPLPLVVMQILAIDLGTETVPALALGVELAEPDIMERPPRSRRERLVDRQMLIRAWVFLGFIEALLVMAGYFWVLYANGWHWGDQLDESSHLYLQATTMTWAGIVATQVGTAFACRTNRASVFNVGFFKNKWLLWGILFEVTLSVMIMYLPFMQTVFHTTGLEWQHWILLALFPPIMFFSDETRKLFTRRAAQKAQGGPI